MSDCLLRMAKDADAEIAVEVLRRSITELCVADHQNHDPTLGRWLRNKTPENFLVWRAATDNSLLVAEIAGVMCGVGAIRQNGSLDLCYVHPGYQRRGIGRSLVLAMESQAHELGVQNIRLISTGSARAFYEKCGYVFVPEESGPGYGVLYDYRYAKTL